MRSVKLQDICQCVLPSVKRCKTQQYTRGNEEATTHNNRPDLIKVSTKSEESAHIVVKSHEAFNKYKETSGQT